MGIGIGIEMKGLVRGKILDMKRLEMDVLLFIKEAETENGRRISSQLLSGC